MEKAAELLKAISHPTRLEIIDLLGKKGSLSVTEIHTHLQIEQAVASHHLSILKDKGVLKSDRMGKNCQYSIKNPCFVDIMKCIENIQN